MGRKPNPFATPYREYWRDHCVSPDKPRQKKMDMWQREELHHILDWSRQPVKTPIEMMVKFAVRSFLDGKDPEPLLLAKGIPPFVLRMAMLKARVFIGNERAKRRRYAKQILESRSRKLPTFTSENFRITIDHTQDRNYGMAQSSIYCVVEVWEAGEDAEDFEKDYLVNFSDYTTKEWLTKLLVWALMNKREVLIKPATQHEMSSMRMFVPKDNVAST